MIKDPILYIEHILKAIDLIEQFTHGISKEDLILDTMAESTQKLPQILKDQNNHIPWKDISGFRNILVHDYLGDIDKNIVWLVITKWLPPLKEAMIETYSKNINN